MARQLRNWLKSYMEYTEETESAKIFHKWVVFSTIAGVLGKKTWFNFGRFKIWPNMYVVLVAEPGIARKSQAISYGKGLIKEIPEIVITADAITKEALTQDLKNCLQETQLPTGEGYSHCSLNIISKEFETFLGQKKENTKMLVLLTDLFDADEGEFKYRTKASGSDIIPAAYLNILGATTPGSLASSLPVSAIGGGLTSRIIFVWAADKYKKVPVPELSSEMLELQATLIRDLTVIARISGEYNFAEGAKEEWINWYNKYEERGSGRICHDPAFHSWYSRKPMYIIKLAQILTVLETTKPYVEWRTFLRAIRNIEEVEYAMERTFSAVGRSEITPDVDMVREIIKERGKIRQSMLMSLIWKDIDATKFPGVIDTILGTGAVTKAGNPGEDCFYIWKGEK